MSSATDRELLELAAKAAGISGDWVDDFGSGDYYYAGNQSGILYALPSGSYSVWNPLTDDGDALRLAEKLSIGLQWCASGRVYAYGDGGEVAESSREDRQSNLRRAVVRAAAEIGRSMP